LIRSVSQVKIAQVGNLDELNAPIFLIVFDQQTQEFLLAEAPPPHQHILTLLQRHPVFVLLNQLIELLLVIFEFLAIDRQVRWRVGCLLKTPCGK
jgi:hypothetical protein